MDLGPARLTSSRMGQSQKTRHWRAFSSPQGPVSCPAAALSQLPFSMSVRLRPQSLGRAHLSAQIRGREWTLFVKGLTGIQRSEKN